MTGLIGWWPLHENTGQANDLSGSGNHGTVNGATQGVAGKGGLTSYSFDGSDDDIDLSSNPGPLTSSSTYYTVSGWLHPLSTSGRRLLIGRTGSNNDNFVFDIENGRLHLYHQRPDNEDNTYSDTLIDSNNWYHVGATWDGSKVSLFINGTLDVSETAGGIASGGNPTKIGSGFASYMNWFKGNLSNIRIYNRALSPQEIQTLYEWGSGDYTNRRYHNGSDPEAVARYKLDGDMTDTWGSNDGNNNGVSFVNNSIRGKAGRFDGSSDYITLSSLPAFGSSGGTISAWANYNVANPGSNNDNIVDIGANLGDGSKERILLQHASDTSYRFLFVSNGSTQLDWSPETNINSNVWYHHVVTWDASKVKYWENGELIATNNTTVDPSVDEGRIGVHINKSGGNYHDGEIDDVRFYNRALEPYEVFQLYQWGTRGRDMRKLTTNAIGDT